jgi:hypothetical protein
MPDLRCAVGLVQFESLSADPAKPSADTKGPFAVLEALQRAETDSPGVGLADEDESFATAGDGHTLVIDADLVHLQQELRAEVSRLMTGFYGQRMPR